MPSMTMTRYWITSCPKHHMDHGYPDEEFVYWRNPEWTPEMPNRFPEGVAEYTVRYSSKEAMDADVNTKVVLGRSARWVCRVEHS